MYYIGCLTHITYIGLDHLGQLLTTEFKKTTDCWWLGAVKEIVDPQCLNLQLEVIKHYAIKVGQDFKKINLVVNTTIDTDDIHCDFNIFSLDTFRAIVYYYKHYAEQKFSTQYNPCDKVLFLIGKPDRIHRTPLLIELIQRNLKENLLYSWYPTAPGDHVFNRVLKTVNESPYKNIDLVNFSKIHTQLLDVLETSLTNNSKTNFHYSGFPFDCSLFEQTSISLVSETDLRSNPLWLTEKIWKTVANHHPFIIAGPAGLASHLRKQGYETWDSFLIHDQDEANSYWYTNPKKGLEMVVDNVDFFIKNNYAKNNLNELAQYNSDLLDIHVQQDIEKNFKSIDTFKTFINRVIFSV